MRIDEVRFRDFRGFEDRRFTFDPNFNVLIGDNGSGKSAVLDGLRAAVGAWMEGIDRVKHETDDFLTEKDIRVVGYMNDSTGRPEYERQGPLKIDVTGFVSDAELDKKSSLYDWTVIRSPETPKEEYEKGPWHISRLAADAAGKARKNEPVVLPLLAYYGTGRLVEDDDDSPDEDSRLKTSRLRGYDGALEPTIRTSEFIEWMKEQLTQSLRQRGPSDMYKAVKDVLARFVMGAREIDYEIGEEPEDDGLYVWFEGEDVPLSEAKSGNTLQFHNLSDGYRAAIALAADIAVRMVRLNSIYLGEKTFQETPGVVLIDELDLHLHPKWQRRIVDDLRRVFPGIQFIVTTHSPFIVQAMEKGEVVALNDGRTETDISMQNQSIETIAEEIMGVSETKYAEEYEGKKEAARNYLEIVMEASESPEEQLEKYEELLASKLEPFDDDPAFQAYLEMKKEGLLRK